jgi:hypothetical protein
VAMLVCRQMRLMIWLPLLCVFVFVIIFTFVFRSRPAGAEKPDRLSFGAEGYAQPCSTHPTHRPQAPTQAPEP